MRRNQKKTVKRNLFDEDEGDSDIKQQQLKKSEVEDELTSKKIIGKADERYDAHQIKQNEHYLGKRQASNELNEEKRVKQEISNKKSVKFSKKKKKNLFDSDDEEQVKKQQQKVEDQQETEPNPKKQNNRQPQPQPQQKPSIKQPFQSNNSSSIQSQQQQQQQLQQQQQDDNEKREQNINEMLKNRQQKTEDKKIKQISFSRLIEKYQDNRNQLKRIIYQPIPQGFRACCIFKRVPSGMSEVYQLIMEDDEVSVMFCQNQRGSIGANYYISLTKQMDKNSQAYLGKLRGNSTGSQYQLYDAGKQPQKKINRKQWRCTMGRIQYQTNILGMNGPRKLKVTLPTAKDLSEYDSFKLSQDQKLENLQPPLISKYRNKQPRWNERLKSYALNFGGKVKQASIKNFILVNDQIPIPDQFNATNHLVFGKIDEHNFSLEAVHPLSIYQAFAIVVSQFDFKLNCQ